MSHQATINKSSGFFIRLTSDLSKEKADHSSAKFNNRGVNLATYYNLFISNMIMSHHSINKVVKNSLLMY